MGDGDMTIYDIAPFIALIALIALALIAILPRRKKRETADVVVGVDIERGATAGEAGLIVAGGNGGREYAAVAIDDENVYLKICIDGVFTTLFSQAYTPSQKTKLMVTKDGTLLSVYLDSESKFKWNIPARMKNNVGVGMYGNGDASAFSDFLLFPRGTGGEYTEKDK